MCIKDDAFASTRAKEKGIGLTNIINRVEPITAAGD